MKQRGLFDEIERLEELTKLGDPLITLVDEIIGIKLIDKF